MQAKHKKRQLVDFFLNRDLFVSNQFIDTLLVETERDKEKLEEETKSISYKSVVVVDDLFLKIKGKKPNIKEFNRLRVLNEKNKENDIFNKLVDSLSIIKQEKEKEKEFKGVKVVFSYEDKSKKRTYNDFVSYFKSRYEQLKSYLINRQELKNTLSINKVLLKKEKEVVSIIAMVTEKKVTRNGNILLKVEDVTGSINVLVNKNKAELFNEAKDISLDEVLAFQGVGGDKIIFINNILWPDIPLNKELKKAPDEVYAVFISDTELGSIFFLEKSFNKFIKWLNQDIGSEVQKKIASKVKYLFITGDLVEGVGVYPNQEQDLTIPDIYEQYQKFSEYLVKIPEHIQIIISPGNHDAMRIAEPQPPLYKDFAKPIYDLSNTILVSNPSYVNIESSETFSGFDVLIYHGYSLIPYSENVESIRILGGQERVDLTMKYLLKRRHLSPTHQSTLSLPTPEKDYMVIDKIPDFFVTGHIHRTTISNYKNITLINASAWTGITPNQEKRGLKPQPARVIIANLQTREMKIMNFEN